jgi:uncharacterized protein
MKMIVGEREWDKEKEIINLTGMDLVATLFNMRFRWNDWNIWHIEKHGVTPSEAEFIVRFARQPYPKNVEDEKRMVKGQTQDGRYLQVIYILDSMDCYYVIHARDLTQAEKSRHKKRANQ